MAVDVVKISKVARRLWQGYGTPAKADNARRLAASRAACAETVDAYPWRIILEPGNVCNLRCCETARDRFDLPRGQLDAAHLEVFLRELWPSLVQVNLFQWGEPFLNRQLPEIIGLIHGRGVGTHVHSNMNHLPAGLAEAIIDAGLDFLVASIDGVTQDVYERYRKGGSCDAALRNLRTFVNVRKAKRKASPRIIWRYLCFPHNVHQLADAARIAEEIGVDDFATGEGWLDGGVWTTEGVKSCNSDGVPETPWCTDLYDFPAVTWDGKLMPCCYASTTGFLWGDLNAERWLEAFNSPAFRNARRLTRGDRATASPCSDCHKAPRRPPGTSSR